MKSINVAILGYGTVGKGVYTTIKNHGNRFKALLGENINIAAVLVKNLEKHQLPDQDVLLTANFNDILEIPQLDVVIDTIVGCEPGFSYLQSAIRKGCHVITANKEMFAHHGEQLQTLASLHQVSIGIEATVAGGIPIIQTLNRLLNVNKITKVEGILNGTSNFILTKMREEGLSFPKALKQAQELGYAEFDPTNDIEGFDAFYKAMILSQVVFGEQPKWAEVDRKGISDISAEKIKLFSKLGLRFKHVAALEKFPGKDVKCSVKPVLVSHSHPLYQIEGVQNAVSVTGDIVGNISIQGPGAGMFPTASAIAEDLIHLGTPSFTNHFTDAQGENEEAGLSYWILTGERIDESLAHASAIDNLGSLAVNTVLAACEEEQILDFVYNYPGTECYQFFGQVIDLDSKDLEIVEI